jgi:ABC-type polysaccharide/polyol phosphate export permease
MKNLKKYLGLVWIVLGPLSVIFMAWHAIEKVAQSSPGAQQVNTALQWGIILLVFIPIAIGLMIFGKYALDDEFDKLPTQSDEL